MNKDTLQRWLQAARAALQARPARERRALLVLAWSLLLAGLLQGLWLLESSRRQLQQQLPRLAAQAEHMKALGQAWQQLAAASPVSPAAAFSRPEVERRVAELGRDVQLQWSGSGELVLKGRTRWDAWLAWSASVHSEQGLVLAQVRVVPAAGGIEIEARYARPAP